MIKLKLSDSEIIYYKFKWLNNKTELAIYEKSNYNERFTQPLCYIPIEAVCLLKKFLNRDLEL